MTPGHQLRVYLAEAKMSIKDFSEFIGCHPVHLSRIINDRGGVGYHLAKAIQEVTNGKVKFECSRKNKKIS